jgi:hypothetical protein
MKVTIEDRLIQVKVFTFPNGVKVDADVIHKFLNEAYDYEDTIGKKGNWTSDYLYFETENELIIEEPLRKYKVIVLADCQKNWNKKAKETKNNPNATKGEKSYYSCYRYWLGSGYLKFKEDFNKEYYK